MIRILIAHGHAIVRCGLLHVFTTLTGDVEVAGQATHGDQVLDFLRHGACDLILLDWSIPGVDAIDLIRRIQAHAPKLPVLVLSRHHDPQVAGHALKAGASGYVTKDVELATLLSAVHKVAAGGRHIDPGLAEQMVFEIEAGAREHPHEQLTNREMSIFRLLVSGKSVNQIAVELSISNKTVSTHKARVMQKMGFQSNMEMLRYGIDRGLLS